MNRILCIRLPNWPLTRLLIARPELKHRPVALYEDHRGPRIFACSRGALARGIVPGMPVAEVSGAHLEKCNPAADRAALEKLAPWCEQFSPTVGLEDAEFPESLLLDVTDTSFLFGGEQALAEQVAKKFAQRGLWIRLAIADTVGAAWAAARHAEPLWIAPAGQTISALTRFPVESLRIADATVQALAELGIRQIGQLLSLPRSTLAGRFEPQLLHRLNQALGIEPELIAAFRGTPEITAERLLEYPVDRRDAIEFLLAQLIDQVATALAARRQGALRLECELVCEGAEPVRFDVGLFQASTQARHLRELTQSRLERLKLPGPVTAVRLSVTLSAKLLAEQRSLFDDGCDTRRHLALLVDRLSSRLGREAVLRPVLVSDSQPEHACRYEPVTGTSRRQARSPAAAAHRPLLVEPRPLPVDTVSVVPDGPPVQFRYGGKNHRIAQSFGPERIQTGWWRGNYIRRDYYRVATVEGNRFWLFRCGGKWFWHGEFD